jgi:hypothetical protein
MGRLYTFECTQCGFQSALSGGQDRGISCFTESCQCLVCKTLFDAVTHVRPAQRLVMPGSDPGHRRLARLVAEVVLPRHVVSSGKILGRPKSMLGRLLPGGQAIHWAEMKVVCPKSDFHRMQPWNHPGPCPRCGVFLEKNTTPKLIWE